ncbi:MAG: lysophospholipid acyltransferase family protein [Planctomycetota bacterium]|jgi:1-acyl-sn-glycerol-3-phosphate acyltransferase
MSTPVILLIIAGWLIAVGLCRWFVVRWLSRGPGADAVTGLIWLIVRVYCRLVHRARYTGLEHVPSTNQPGGLVVVSNHTSPIDPLLLQAACRFHIRWMMASDMMVPQLDWLWRRYQVIAVSRDGSDTAPAREAIRHVREGGVVGIFPEGGIENPPGGIRPFLAGVGLVVARAKAPVLLAWISGTPECPDMLPALTTPSRARLQFIDVIDFGEERDALAITDHLRCRIAEASGWPTSDEPLARPRLEPDPFAA